MSLLRRSGQQALQALLELAEAPQQWRSVNEIAAAQALPAPMLEQLLLQLRRAGLVEARRGRLGGYRLQRQPAAILVAEVLAAVGAEVELIEPEPAETSRAEQQVLRSMARRLQRALGRELMQFNLEELLFDLRSCRETLSGDGGLMLG
ncbi:MAG: Rrf2 family transcriptional regulator [Vulcanococcus sp.]